MCGCELGVFVSRPLDAGRRANRRGRYQQRPLPSGERRRCATPPRGRAARERVDVRDEHVRRRVDRHLAATGAHVDPVDARGREPEHDRQPVVVRELVERGKQVDGVAAAVRAASAIRGIEREAFELPDRQLVAAAARAERDDAAVTDCAVAVEREHVHGPPERILDELVAQVVERAVLVVDRAVELRHPFELRLVERTANSPQLDHGRRTRSSRARHHSSTSRNEANHAPRSTP
jgi:hypothetical protein